MDDPALTKARYQRGTIDTRDTSSTRLHHMLGTVTYHLAYLFLTTITGTVLVLVVVAYLFLTTTTGTVLVLVVIAYLFLTTITGTVLVWVLIAYLFLTTITGTVLVSAVITWFTCSRLHTHSTQQVCMHTCRLIHTSQR